MWKKEIYSGAMSLNVIARRSRVILSGEAQERLREESQILRPWHRHSR